MKFFSTPAQIDRSSTRILTNGREQAIIVNRGCIHLEGGARGTANDAGLMYAGRYSGPIEIGFNGIRYRPRP
ncbi:MAG TPA: hypothetical protein PKD64_11300 [Pirellulaceae bacterium]|nr:hypothetical protein [Pirellulaceae bacterium]HMO92768.1 hypothetical protein [Pirellulaceae bacterium]HMP69350.1 hypothetical protein [Pirellulaceae bacterium]